MVFCRTSQALDDDQPENGFVGQSSQAVSPRSQALVDEQLESGSEGLLSQAVSSHSRVRYDATGIFAWPIAEEEATESEVPRVPSPGFAFPGPLSDDELLLFRDLLDMSSSGLSVAWPDGWSAGLFASFLSHLRRVEVSGSDQQASEPYPRREGCIALSEPRGS